MSGPRHEGTRRAIEAMRQLRRASSLPIDTEIGDRRQALAPVHKTPLVRRDPSREEPRIPD
jgi:hypothetical protein